jgi:NitT/TauT family transport system substrate-binding protein
MGVKNLPIVLALLCLPLFGCESSPTQDPLKIVANAWIGYSPLFFAKEKGWLEPLNIKVVHVVSLGESMQLYEVGSAQAFTGTQYEYAQVRDKDPTLIPVILFDRSFGADMVMSNRSVAQLQQERGQIDVYLEIDSVNQLILSDFVQRNNVPSKDINFINRDQAGISTLDAARLTRPTLIITYVPYNSELKRHGFMEIGNTRSSLDLLVVDALYTKQATFSDNKARFQKLKQTVDRAIEFLNENPREYHRLVSPYLGELPYDDFREGLQGIRWLNADIEPQIAARMSESGFPASDLLP